MRRIKREARGISPIIATILLIAVTAVAGGIIAAYVAGIYVPLSRIGVTADARGTVLDKNEGTADNFQNGKLILEVKIMSDDIDDVLDPTNPLKISIVGRGKAWPTIDVNLKDSGKTEADYGKTIMVNGVKHWKETAEDNLNIYWKVMCPTTSGGELDEGMALRIEMWPTTYDITADVAASGSDVSGTYVFDNDVVGDFWDERETIDITLSGRADALTLTGFNGAYLYGQEIDK